MSDDESDEEVTVTADAVRQDNTRISDELDVYRDDDGDSTPSDTDAEKLFETPTVDKLRWLYAETSYAPTVVDKPIDDAFKHGYTIDDTHGGTVEDFLDEYIPYQKRARKKARRDGNAFIFWNIEDSAAVHYSPENPRGVVDYHVLDLGDLHQGSLSPTQIEEYVDYDDDQFTVTDDGMVWVEDITSTDHEDFLGVVYERSNTENTNDADSVTIFIHADRLHIFGERETVDGDLDDNSFPRQGESILSAIFHPLVQLEKATWALGQSLFRYAGPLHVVEIDGDIVHNLEGDTEEHVENLHDNLNDLNSASETVLPPGHSMETLGNGGELDPSPYVEPLVEQVCAGSEMTKSVLMGTQSGTVSGSETDIKNYFNQVHRYREQTAIETMEDGFAMYRKFADDVAANLDGSFTVDWEPIFKLDALDRASGFSKIVNSVGTGLTNYLLTHEEARNLVEDAAVELEIPADLDDEVTEEEMDIIDRITSNKMKGYAEGRSAENEYEREHLEEQETPEEGQNGGGMPAGEQTASESPDTDS